MRVAVWKGATHHDSGRAEKTGTAALQAGARRGATRTAQNAIGSQVPLDRLMLTLADDGLPFGAGTSDRQWGLAARLSSRCLEQVPLDDEARELGFFGRGPFALPIRPR